MVYPDNKKGKGQPNNTKSVNSKKNNEASKAQKEGTDKSVDKSVDGNDEEKSKTKEMESLSDTILLNQVNEAQNDFRSSALEIEKLKNKIIELRNRIPVTDKDQKEIDRAQEEVQDRVMEMEILTRRINILLDRYYKSSRDASDSSGHQEKFGGVCVRCKKEVCICSDADKVCICLPAKCVCKKGKPFKPGSWRRQQMDPFPIKKPRCTCVKDGVGICTCIGNLDETCTCRQYLLDMDNCDCRREDHESCRHKNAKMKRKTEVKTPKKFGSQMLSRQSSKP